MRPRWILAFVLAGAVAVVLLAMRGSREERAGKRAAAPAPSAAAAVAAKPAYDASRIVSLAPAITETLFALGKGEAVVGVAMYSDFPPEAKRIAQVGAGTNPDLEAIARTRPTLILGEETKILPASRLEALGPTRLLPWLTPAEIVRSVRELGAIVDREAAADAIADEMERRWNVKPAAGAPRVLMLFVDAPGRIGPMYFAKPGSLHEALLVAAGGRNAIEGEVSGLPTLSVEGLLRLDPDAIVLLTASDELSEAARAQFLADFAELSTLRAVKLGRVRVLNGSILYVTGPRVMAVIDQVQAALRDMGVVAPAPAPAPAAVPAPP
jgi:ABC-type Fe3+-hydroxamate transport system substrate-binding protein